MSENLVLWERDREDAFVTLTLNRPDKMNAMNQALGDALEAAITRAIADRDIRAVILTGAGRAFSAGFDLGGEDFELDAERSVCARGRVVRVARDSGDDVIPGMGIAFVSLSDADREAIRALVTRGANG